jgi:hypothetical protein
MQRGLRSVRIQRTDRFTFGKALRPRSHALTSNRYFGPPSSAKLVGFFPMAIAFSI